ncbi:hypothetical protein WJX72_002242 [[Myrmecia] bisecta]|uniref:Peptide-N(4)-(N-acetyl-beta-glucosaminyl)asparagine amidase n=1 Tax=[Myrmecia] bisecta TaxID=41462 RepID=A0AAW1QEE7_9CHLO
MDADEALARALQAEEHQLAFASRQPAADGHQEFATRLQAAVQTVLQYEDQLLQALALSVVPLEELQREAAEQVKLIEAMGEQPPLAAEDALAQGLLAWFKADFFKWVNNPACQLCGGSNTQGTGVAGPTAEEAAGGAGRTEVYRCVQCGSITRFPRYNDPAKLLETRSGRCGEWANCFTLCCRAVGLDARYVLDWTDHVWTEYYSHALRRWVHLDPCEVAYDKPLLYEVGWGKPLSYVLGFSKDEVVDVTRRYTKQWGQLRLRRTQADEGWLRQYLQQLSGRLQAELPPDLRAVLRERLEREVQQLAQQQAQPVSADEAAMPGRQTGSAAWRAVRGETGTSTGTCAVPALLTGTRFRLAKDDHQNAHEPRAVCGGAVRASGENAPSETAVQAFDGRADTKWLDFGGANGGLTWLEYRLPNMALPAVVDEYALTSANDSPERDPCNWTLEGWADGENWTALDGGRHQMKRQCSR